MFNKAGQPPEKTAILYLYARMLTKKALRKWIFFKNIDFAKSSARNKNNLKTGWLFGVNSDVINIYLPPFLDNGASGNIEPSNRFWIL